MKLNFDFNTKKHSNLIFDLFNLHILTIILKRKKRETERKRK